jgi:hypothetical protein
MTAGCPFLATSCLAVVAVLGIKLEKFAEDDDVQKYRISGQLQGGVGAVPEHCSTRTKNPVYWFVEN